MSEIEDEPQVEEPGNAVDADESESDVRVVVDLKLIHEAGDESPRVEGDEDGT